MGFEGLLGNERLKENLTRSFARGHISHFYLISGPEGSGKHTLARLLGAAAVCNGQQKPCLGCNACRKVMADTHPDFITVDDPEKKTVTVDLVRDARADMFVQPNEADRKVYLFPRAQDMRTEGQNALLKVLEEPPAYGVFILLTDNPEKLLPTVRSRCTELKLLGLPENLLRRELTRLFPKVDEEQLQGAIVRSGGYLGQAKRILEEGSIIDPKTEAFAQAFMSRNSLQLSLMLQETEKMKRDQFIPLLQQWLEVLENAVTCRCGIQTASALARQLSTARSLADIMAAVEEIKKCMEYAQGNVSVAAICGYLTWHLR